MAVFFVSTFVIIFGAPYVPTLASTRRAALDLLDLKPGQTLYELGSGDGSLIKEAAARGLNVVGYELNPLLVLISKVRTRRYKKQVKIVWSNFWKADFSNADGIFVFQMDRSMKKLEAKIKTEAKGRGIKVASHAFKIPGKVPAKKSGAVLLYVYNPVANSN
jgi:hypothetical protein